ncbi:MAG: benzoyl-CoA-dihydrodiol lyase [Alphaproteobacteria bacterium]|nr:benzoyl-CoA-dihydrodiol lyase [Alphaproteobacteria bacterium]
MGHGQVVRVDSFEAHPSAYRHWRLGLDGPVATLTLDIGEDNGLRPDYQLKQNSYDLGVDIELRDVSERLRFEHPEVRVVLVTSAQPKVFCAGANIPMLGTSTHHFKVNFCKYTNETRVGLEEATSESGQVWVAALNGTAAGGGYELALACEEILLIDDRSSAVSLPEVPLLGVLPGTGGLTRLVDKRRVRRDVADLFCTKAEGFRARDALRLGLVDATYPRSRWEEAVQARALEVAAARPARASQGIALPPLEVEVGADGARTYGSVQFTLSDDGRTATLLVQAPTAPPPTTAEALRAEGASTWALRAFRELDDALVHLRFNFPEVGLVLLRTAGDPVEVLAHDAALHALAGDWLADEITWLQARVLRHLDNTAKSMFAVVDEGSCFAGCLAEVVLAADRAYMLDVDGGPTLRVTRTASEGRLPMATGLTRLQNRFFGDVALVEGALATEGRALGGAEALELGLVTLAPDDLDWEDELRIAVEERVSLSPDALTGMEQNLRFVGPETCETRIYGRLSAWQNWIFQRPNATGEQGALTLYGHPERPRFDWERT